MREGAIQYNKIVKQVSLEGLALEYRDSPIILPAQTNLTQETNTLQAWVLEVWTSLSKTT